MAKLFADRAYVTVNGFEMLHVKSADVSIDEALSPVDTMSRSYRSAGFKRGNKKFNISLEMEIEQSVAQIDLALAKQGADIRVVFECGGERYIFKDVAQASADMRGSVGDASKSIKLIALDGSNENGSAVNTGISLG